MSKKSKTLKIEGKPEKSKDRLIADVATGGIVNSAGVVSNFSKDYLGEISLTDCMDALTERADSVHGGDLKDLEVMLTSQAIALDSIFTALALRAKSNMGEYINATDKYLRLALKAQSQCRTTLQTLAEIKNPKPYIQNNRAQYQQVNNGAAPTHDSNETSTRTRARARENEKGANELLEDKKR